jgi:hypothetical protein
MRACEMSEAKPLHRETAAQTDAAVSQMKALVRRREDLSTPFHQAFEHLGKSASGAELEVWARAGLSLANVNAGPATLIAYWSLTTLFAGQIEIQALADMAHAGAEICRYAGAGATRAVFNAGIALGPKLGGFDGAWWRGWLRLAREAPGCVEELAPRAAGIIAACGTEGFENFIAAGLRSTRERSKQRLAFFRLEDPSARVILDRLPGRPGFQQIRQRMRGFVTALWGITPPILAAQTGRDGRMIRRSTIAGGVVRIPEVFSGVPATDIEPLFGAAVAHAAAHLAHGKGRFPVGLLKPLQIVLIGLIEDARIEALAMRRFPGLRRLWAPFHVAEPSQAMVAPLLLARLARALFDAEYSDNNGFVAKGRQLFAGIEDLENPEHSRRIGGLLGNDLGQMRIQFDAKAYVPEPVYRDDNLGLWEFPQDRQPPPAEEDIHVEAVRTQASEGSQANERPGEAGDETVGRARPAAGSGEGLAVATYPEWDRAAQIERADWTTVREVPPPLGDADRIKIAIEREAALKKRIERLVRGAKAGRVQPLRRQPAGTDFDLDALIDAAISLRTGHLSDDRVFRANAPQSRDLAISVLIDISESTRDKVPAAGTSIAELEKLAVAVLASVMETAGDEFTLCAFASDGRHDVRFIRIKDFSESFGHQAMARLAGLQPGLSTRLGTGLRHAGAALARIKASRKIVLALTDGAPSDVDVTDPLDLIEDARRAALQLHAQAIDAFGIVLDPTGLGAGAAVFGRTNYLPIHRIEELPGRLSDLYFRLTRR